MKIINLTNYLLRYVCKYLSLQDTTNFLIALYRNIYKLNSSSLLEKIDNNIVVTNKICKIDYSNDETILTSLLNILTSRLTQIIEKKRLDIYNLSLIPALKQTNNISYVQKIYFMSMYNKNDNSVMKEKYINKNYCSTLIIGKNVNYNSSFFNAVLSRNSVNVILLDKYKLSNKCIRELFKIKCTIMSFNNIDFGYLTNTNHVFCDICNIINLDNCTINNLSVFKGKCNISNCTIVNNNFDYIRDILPFRFDFTNCNFINCTSCVPYNYRKYIPKEILELTPISYEMNYLSLEFLMDNFIYGDEIINNEHYSFVTKYYWYEPSNYFYMLSVLNNSNYISYDCILKHFNEFKKYFSIFLYVITYNKKSLFMRTINDNYENCIFSNKIITRIVPSKVLPDLHIFEHRLVKFMQCTNSTQINSQLKIRYLLSDIGLLNDKIIIVGDAIEYCINDNIDLINLNDKYLELLLNNNKFTSIKYECSSLRLDILSLIRLLNNNIFVFTKILIKTTGFHTQLNLLLNKLYVELRTNLPFYNSKINRKEQPNNFYKQSQPQPQPQSQQSKTTSNTNLSKNSKKAQHKDIKKSKNRKSFSPIISRISKKISRGGGSGIIKNTSIHNRMLDKQFHGVNINVNFINNKNSMDNIVTNNYENIYNDYGITVNINENSNKDEILIYISGLRTIKLSICYTNIMEWIIENKPIKQHGYYNNKPNITWGSIIDNCINCNDYITG